MASCNYYPIIISEEEFDLGTVLGECFHSGLRVACSNRHLMHIVHLAQISEHRLGTCEQLTHVANEAIFPAHAHAHSDV